MTDTPIDPAATPENEDAPDIAADDAGASGLAEQAQKAAWGEPGEQGEDA